MAAGTNLGPPLARGDVMRSRLIIWLIVLAIGLTTRSAVALTIDFIGSSGGNISYLGGATFLTGTNLPIDSLFTIPPGGSSTISITGGLMNFTTGAYLGGINLGGGAFLSTYGSGGGFGIIGGIPSLGIAAGTTLMTATFATNPTFQNLGVGGFGNVSGGLNVTSLNSALAASFGLPSGPIGSGTGAFSQLNLAINPVSLPFGPGIGFTASQSSANIVATISEPASLLLLGLGLLVIGFFGRQKPHRKQRVGGQSF